MPFGIQPIHIVLIILVAFLIFGANKLPELGRSLGKTISEFRKGTKEAAEGFKEEIQKPAGLRQPLVPVTPLPPADPYAPAQTAPVQSGPAQTAPVQLVRAASQAGGPTEISAFNAVTPTCPKRVSAPTADRNCPKRLV